MGMHAGSILSLVPSKLQQIYLCIGLASGFAWVWSLGSLWFSLVPEGPKRNFQLKANNTQTINGIC